MLSRSDLKKIAVGRLRDSEALLKMKRFDAAIYLCGYAVEVALKARICRALRWAEFPQTRNEFRDYQSFRTHDLNVLLHLNGVETKIRPALLREWSAVAEWDPESRYRPPGSASKIDAEFMIQSVKVILGAL